MGRICKREKGRGDIGELDFVHPAKRLLKSYKETGAPVKVKRGHGQ